jgi:aspartyl aminopeptidase
MKELVINFFDFLGLAWWVEITTAQPRCTYYFGPFMSSDQAHGAKPGYIEDLEKENAQKIKVTVKRCKPANLTIDESGATAEVEQVPFFSNQHS